MTEVEKLRVDKYLWAIRVFKTRSLATDACKAGRVKLDGRSVKPSALVRVGDSYHIQKGPEKRVLRVTGLLDKRVDAKTAVAFYEDCTPVEETYAYKAMHRASVPTRDRGTGRPTKRDRREIDSLQNDWWEED
ncbi:RNA-binding S4 domain-containing protein [Parapedobacter sp. 10938]|uniref:RNA-binding S4 domain-containing protein n=1 Tax=Parapedobacter flavus TaxID=3110225 RepID=UPI002DBD9E66|nr:RNA-binding S4 domain-containing protein [Parapedobacter sp. 10938]MEC3879234.1 RNA-binding S4 domain-containing protein [Parapedobacter sp. 10938]